MKNNLGIFLFIFASFQHFTEQIDNSESYIREHDVTNAIKIFCTGKVKENFWTFGLV